MYFLSGDFTYFAGSEKSLNKIPNKSKPSVTQFFQHPIPALTDSTFGPSEKGAIPYCL
jgi:hypothetical protein